jgi:hypothetical protein|tara:strand:- start:379 stop:546 length:168 start_codon:yes stop_codon:yes gene_type:complete
MSITKAKYFKHDNKNESIQATINEVDVCVPLDEDNTDYQAILKWVEDGNTIQEAD